MGKRILCEDGMVSVPADASEFFISKFKKPKSKEETYKLFIRFRDKKYFFEEYKDLHTAMMVLKSLHDVNHKD